MIICNWCFWKCFCSIILLNTGLENHTVPSDDVISKPPSFRPVDAFSTLALRPMITRKRQLTEREKLFFSTYLSRNVYFPSLLSLSPFPFPSCRSSAGNPTPILSAARQVLCHWPANPLNAAICEATCSSLEIVSHSKSITSVHVSVTKPTLKKSDGNILADTFSSWRSHVTPFPLNVPSVWGNRLYFTW